MNRRCGDKDGAKTSVMRAAGASPTVPYPGHTKRWQCICDVCERTVYPSYSNVRRGQRACQFCAGTGITPDDAVESMMSAGLCPLEPYPGNGKTPWKCRCLVCGVVGSPRYGNVAHRKRGCASCAKHGIKYNSPGWLYLLQSKLDSSAYQVGITNDLKRRMGEHKSNWDIIATTHYAEVRTASKIETLMLRRHRRDDQRSRPLTSRRAGGWSEVRYGESFKHELIALMMSSKAVFI